jgi:hypothetical protein
MWGGVLSRNTRNNVAPQPHSGVQVVTLPVTTRNTARNKQFANPAPSTTLRCTPSDGGAVAPASLRTCPPLTVHQQPWFAGYLVVQPELGRDPARQSPPNPPPPPLRFGNWTFPRWPCTSTLGLGHWNLDISVPSFPLDVNRPQI